MACECCITGFSNLTTSFTTNGIVSLVSPDNSIAIDTSLAGVISLTSTGSGTTGSGDNVSDFSISYDDTSGILTGIVTLNSGTSFTDTTVIDTTPAITDLRAVSNVVSYDQTSSILTSLITLSDGSVLPSTTTIPTSSTSGSVNETLSLGFDSATNVLTATVTQSNGGIDVSGSASLASLISSSGNPVASYVNSYDSNTELLTSTITLTDGTPFIQTTSIPNTVNEVVTFNQSFSDVTNELTTTITQLEGTTPLSTSTIVPVVTTNSLTFDSATCEIVSTVTQSVGGTKEARLDLSSVLLEAICKIPSVTLDETHTVFKLFGLDTNNNCIIIDAESCTISTCTAPNVLSAIISDGATTGTSGLSALTTVVQVNFDQQVDGVIGDESVSQIGVYGQTGETIAGIWAYQGTNGSNHVYEFTHSSSWLQSYSYTINAQATITTANDATCTLANPGDIVTFSTAAITNNQVLNGGFDVTSTSWNDGNATLTLQTPGANGTTSYLNVDTISAGTPVQAFQTGNFNINAGTTYYIGFWHLGDSARARLIQHGSPFANYGLNFLIPTSSIWTYYVVEFTANTTATDGRLTFIETSPIATTSYCIDEVQLGDG